CVEGLRAHGRAPVTGRALCQGDAAAFEAAILVYAFGRLLRRSGCTPRRRTDASLAPPSGPAADYTKAVAVAVAQPAHRWPSRSASPTAARCATRCRR
ncbi:hypothetical protein ACR42A_36035, partial [Burkholderia gladioli]|uniref:hypothetical protein n=1 Tax=Burkholderia gladioli TaxID=28095 RepID=UPI003DA6677F